jgi:hypothetical protein
MAQGALAMLNATRRVDYMYVTVPNKPGEAARVLEALREGAVNLLVLSGFPQGRGKSQIDVVTDDIDATEGGGEKAQVEAQQSEARLARPGNG